MKTHPVYHAALSAWRAGANLRSRRRRFKDFTYGRQWADIVTTPKGERMTEGEYATISGKKPLTNNMIRQLVKSVVGRFRHSLQQHEHQAMELRLQEAASRNMLDELDCRLLEEFLISGCAIQRIVSERRLEGGESVWVDNVAPERFFVNRFSHPRGSDIELIGMLHDMSLAEVLMRFGASDTARMERLRQVYARTAVPMHLGEESAGPGDEEHIDFHRAPRGRCRVIEAWALEPRDLIKCHDPESSTVFYIDAADGVALAELNEGRAARGEQPISATPHPTMRWHAYFFGPDGELITDYDSPYAHGLHPFALKLYPLTDGEVHPFVEDVIDQQKFINRLISQIDHILSFSAKGVLLFPEDQKPDDLSWAEVASQWCTPNGIVPYRNSMGREPHQAYSAGGTQGAQELLGIEMRLFEQISGVSGALKGETPAAAQSAALYESQVRNADISLLDIFNTFNSFRTLRNHQILNT